MRRRVRAEASPEAWATSGSTARAWATRSASSSSTRATPYSSRRRGAAATALLASALRTASNATGCWAISPESGRSCDRCGYAVPLIDRDAGGFHHLRVLLDFRLDELREVLRRAT